MGIKNIDDKGLDIARQAAPGALEFMGNWFIDAGIMGFEGMTEEVNN